MTDELDPELAVLKKAVGQLMEHFDSVRVVVTRHEPNEDGGRTMSLTWGGGNIYAQQQSVSDWIEKQREHLRSEVREERADEEPADDE